MNNLRCPSCGRLIVKYSANGVLEVEFVCSRCNSKTLVILGEKKA